YHLRFHASSTVQVTALSIRRVNFYNAGLFVTPVHATGCQVGIGVNLGVDDSAPRLLPLLALPNPSFGAMEFRSSDEISVPVEIRIVDVLGRPIWSAGPQTLGARGRLTWDGRNLHGVPAAPGLYLAHIRRGGAAQVLRVIRIP